LFNDTGCGLCLSWLPASTINAQAGSTDLARMQLSDPSGVGNADPAAVFAGGTSLLTVVVTPGSDPSSTGLTVATDLTGIGGSAAQTFFDDGSNGDVTSGDNTFTYLATVASGTSAGAKILPATISDAEARSGSATINLVVKPPLVAIHTIQGASHLSPLNGLYETTQGIVIALRSNGFYMQDPEPDADEATSEGIFVFTRSAPAVLAGDLVEVVGTVTEFRPGGAGGLNNLTTTELSTPDLIVTVLSSANPLPAPPS